MYRCNKSVNKRCKNSTFIIYIQAPETVNLHKFYYCELNNFIGVNIQHRQKIPCHKNGLVYFKHLS